MLREAYHPNAYLENVKNVKLGLASRTKLLNVLEKSSNDARALAKEAGITYGVVMHHLKLLRAEDIVDRKQSRPYVWTLTGMGQKRLINLS
jgi:predicted ArsR family transcriptional regulator